MSGESLDHGREDLEGAGESNKLAKGISRLKLACMATIVVSCSLLCGVVIGFILVHIQLRDLSQVRIQ